MENRAANFLQLIRRSNRGRLKIYLGYGPGVGKTYQMLEEGHRLKDDGIDVVAGLVETHGRLETAALLEGLEIIPRRKVEYRGITIEEMDVDAILARKPQVVLVDELAHTNAPDSRNPKRFQDVQEILAAGIHVISAMNVQHLESLYHTVEQLLGVRVRERLPDSVLAEADVVVNVDLAAEDLQRRLREGKIYPKERVATALENFFTPSNLAHLRELTMRELASQLDFKRREDKIRAQDSAAGSEQVMVCLSSRGPNSARLLRYGSRLAGRLNRNWYAVYVQTPSEEPTAIDARTQRLLSDTLTLANQLGATVFTFKGQDIADTILRFANEYRVGNVIIGRPRRIPWFRALAGERSVAEQLIRRSKGVTVIVVDAELEDEQGREMPAETAPGSTAATTRPSLSVGDLLFAHRVVIWDHPATRDEIFKRLARALANDELVLADKVLGKLQDREREGSTFLNEGVALPHARLDSLPEPRIAIGLTHEGVLDSPTETPIEVVFLLVSPTESPQGVAAAHSPAAAAASDGAADREKAAATKNAAGLHLKLLARAGRMLQSRELRRRLAKVTQPADAVREIRQWERDNRM